MVSGSLKRLLAVILASTVIGSTSFISVSAASATTAKTSASSSVSYDDNILKDIEALPAPVNKVSYKYVLCEDEVLKPGKYLIVNAETATVMQGLKSSTGSIETFKTQFSDDSKTILAKDITPDCVYTLDNAPGGKYYIKDKDNKYVYIYKYGYLKKSKDIKDYSSVSINRGQVKKTDKNKKDYYEKTSDNAFIISAADSEGTLRDLSMYKSDWFTVHNHSDKLTDSGRFMYFYKQVVDVGIPNDTTKLYDAIIKAKEHLYVNNKIRGILTKSIYDYNKAYKGGTSQSNIDSDVKALNSMISENSAKVKAQYDSIIKEIDNLYNESDYTKNTLKKTATKASVEELANKVKYFNIPELSKLLINRAQKLINNQSKKVTSREFILERKGDLKKYAETELEVAYLGTNKVVTGIWASPYKTLYVYVDADKSEANLPELYITQNVSYDSSYRVKLNAGLNRVEVPLLKSLRNTDDYEQGGAVYLLNPYTAEQQKKQVKVYIDGGDQFPVYKKGQSSKTFLKNLNDYAAHLDKNEEGYHNIVELCSNHSIMTFEIKHNKKNDSDKNFLETVNTNGFDFSKAMDKWDQFSKKLYEFNGMSYKEYKDMKIQVRAKNLSAGVGASATNEVINIYAHDETKVLTGDYNWGIPHEYGHCLDNPERTYGEVTNNMWSMKNVLDNGLDDYYVAVKKLNDKNHHYDINQIAVNTKTNFWQGRDGSNYFWTLFIFWDLEVYHNGYWTTFNNMYRDDSCGNKTVDDLFEAAEKNAETDDEKDILKREKMAVYSAAATKTDLTKYFVRYGFISDKPSETYTKSMKALKLPELNKKIWYYNTRTYEDIKNSSRNDNKSVSGTFSFNMDTNNTLYFNLSGNYSSAHLGYEIVKDGKIIGFTWDSSFKLDKSVTSGDIKVNAYDRMLNVYATKTIKYTTLKSAKKPRASIRVSPAGTDFITYNNTTLGSTVTVWASASSGVGNYTYKFEAINKTKNNKTTLIKGFSSDSSVDWKPSVYGEYTVKVTVKDKNGNTGTSTFSFTFKPGLGDVIGDGTINVADASAIEKYLAKKATLDKYQIAAADVDYDGAVTKADATHIREYSVKLITKFNGLSSYNVQLPAVAEDTVVYLKKSVSKDEFSAKVNIPESTTQWLKVTPVIDSQNMVKGIKIHNYLNQTNSDRKTTVTVKIEGGEYTLNVGQKKYVLDNKSTVNKTSITLGDTVTIKPNASADYGPCTYKITYIKKSVSGSTTLCDYTATPKTSFKPDSYGNYTVSVFAKDSKNRFKLKSFKITVNLKKGDVNGDGRLSVSDASYLQMALADMVTLDEFQNKAADFNGDGRITVSDVTALQMKLADM